MKIGVTCDNERLNCAFTDYKTGWGFYPHKNELRHERNNRTYSLVFPPEAVRRDVNHISVIFDRETGGLSFSCNGYL
jgi:hypothetical protein